jgi:hypothetical protein
MDYGSRGKIMSNQNPIAKKHETKIKRLNEKEKALLSIILMNKGSIKGTRLKRIYLEKYSLWDLQSTQEKLNKQGLLVKLSKERTSETSVYTIPRKFHGYLEPQLAPSSDYPKDILQNHLSLNSCCQEFSILWYLMQVDTILGSGLVGSRSKKVNRMASKRVEDILGITDDDSRFIIHLIKDLTKSKLFKKNKINHWSDVLNLSYSIVKKIYRIVYYDLSDNSHLGAEDVGKDNVDFLIDEVTALNSEVWYPLESFVANAKTTLFSANQPDRWIYFNEDNIWKILNRDFKLVEIVKTYEDHLGQKFFSPTILGDYCFDGLSQEEFQNKLIKRKGKLLVHPNFEVTLVSRELNPKVILELAMFSNIVKTDTVCVFKISRESVELGIKRGLSPDRMIGFLEENCKGKVPQNVEYSISDWTV